MDPYEYQEQAKLTLSGKFYGEKVTNAELRFRIAKALDAANSLDQVKKALFYGKGEDLGLTRACNVATAEHAVVSIAEGMMLSDTFAGFQFDEGLNGPSEQLLHMALGMFTEAGEFLEAVFKAINGEPLDRINMLEEFGDNLWYIANGLTILKSGFPEEFHRNNAKLRKRFPDGFTEHDANNRDLTAERNTLEGN